MTTLSDRLRAWRRRWRLTQAQAAATLRVPKTTLENWEQGRNRPRGLSLEALVAKLENPPE